MQQGLLRVEHSGGGECGRKQEGNTEEGQGALDPDLCVTSAQELGPGPGCRCLSGEEAAIHTRRCRGRKGWRENE